MADSEAQMSITETTNTGMDRCPNYLQCYSMDNTKSKQLNNTKQQ